MEQIKLALEQYAKAHPEIKDHILGIQFALLDTINCIYKEGLDHGLGIAEGVKEASK
jgi:hypothetical protein